MKRMLTLASLALLASFQANAQTPSAAAPGAPPAPPPGMPPPPPADELPLAVATDWAQAAIAACKANGYSVTATYMNTNFTIKLLMRSDATREMTVDIGRRKAYTVLKTGMTSGDFAASVGFPAGTPMPRPAPGQPFGLPPGPNPDPNLVVAAGGLPVKIGGKVVGAVSISGAPGGDKDEVCAVAGLAKIADKLK